MAGKRTAERMASIRRDSRPAGILSLSRLRADPQLTQGSLANGSLPWIDVDTLKEHGAGFSGLSLEPSDTAIIQYTSGSTSAPKGVVLSHGNLIANTAMITRAFGDEARSCGVSWLPLFHDMGLVGHVLQPVHLGAHSVLMSPLSFLQRPVRWLEAVSNWQGTTSGGPAGAFDLCTRLVREEEAAALDLASWRVAYCGSEKVRPDMLERFSARFAPYGFAEAAIFPCYGLAEATLMVSGRHGLSEASPMASPDSSTPMAAASCGPSAAGSSIVIVDPDACAILPDTAVGEVWIGGPHVAQGYWNHSEGAATFGARLSDGLGPYLRTGDLGFLQGGELFIVGRIKDLMVVNGVKHAAEDIEKTVALSDPNFAGALGAAFAIEGDGREEAVVVQEVPRAAVQAALRANAAARAAAAVVGHHGLRLRDVVLVLVGKLPRTSSGKVQRGKAREAYLAGTFERLGEK
jgi:acyl-CoA synthetase (AMP-forming)/AMP-acid ligase II